MTKTDEQGSRPIDRSRRSRGQQAIAASLMSEQPRRGAEPPIQPADPKPIEPGLVISFRTSDVLADLNLKIGARESIAVIAGDESDRSSFVRTLFDPSDDASDDRRIMDRQAEKLPVVDGVRDDLLRAGLGHLPLMLRTSPTNLTRADRICLAILQAAAHQPELLCLYRPTADLDQRSADQVLALVHVERRKHAILMVTESLRQGRVVADRLLWIDGDSLVERPQADGVPGQTRSNSDDDLHTAVGDRGGIAAVEQAAVVQPKPLGSQALSNRRRKSVIPDSRGPQGFRWAVDGELGGTAQPGIVNDVEQDLAALRRVGASLLVSLTEEIVLEDAMLRRHGLQSAWFPIDDMGTPSLPACLELIDKSEEAIRQGGTVIYHCKAGHGRTGLMLVAHLIRRGLSAADALAAARERKKQWVQSPEQKQFLVELERYVGGQKINGGTER